MSRFFYLVFYDIIDVMEILGKLFGSTGRVRILKLFIFNSENVFESADVARRVKVNAEVARKEIGMLSRIGFIKKRVCYKDVEKKARGKTVVKKKKINGWTLNSQFPYLESLKTFLTSANSLTAPEITKRLQNTGRLKLVIVSGVFIKEWNSRLDILIVGSKIHQPKLKAVIRDMEAELGKEIEYALFSVPDFKYRLSVYDKLVRDVLDYPHEVAVDRIGVR